MAWPTIATLEAGIEISPLAVLQSGCEARNTESPSESPRTERGWFEKLQTTRTLAAVDNQGSTLHVGRRSNQVEST